jgi:nucleoside-diphosphate-sugar epimerase
MIVGKGLIAKSFKKFLFLYKNDVIFASGLSNSTSKKKNEFQRELILLEKIINNNQKKKIFYFSTLDVLRKKKTDYIIHKKKIEKILIKRKNSLILRLPQVIGHSENQFTTYNFLKFNLKKKNKITIYPNYYRNFIDVDDIPLIINKIKKNNIKSKFINIFCYKSIKILYLVNMIVKKYKLRNFKFEINLKNDNFYKSLKKFKNTSYFSVCKKKYYINMFNKYL